jgi:hypothetical protein
MRAHLNVDLSGGERHVLKMTLPEVKSAWSDDEKVVLDWTCGVDITVESGQRQRATSRRVRYDADARQTARGA